MYFSPVSRSAITADVVSIGKSVITRLRMLMLMKVGFVVVLRRRLGAPPSQQLLPGLLVRLFFQFRICLVNPTKATDVT